MIGIFQRGFGAPTGPHFPYPWECFINWAWPQMACRFDVHDTEHYLDTQAATFYKCTRCGKVCKKIKE